MGTSSGAAIGVNQLGSGSGSELVNAVLQNSQGTEVQSGAQMMQHFISGRASEQLTGLVGSQENLSELTDTITSIINCLNENRVIHLTKTC